MRPLTPVSLPTILAIVTVSLLTQLMVGIFMPNIASAAISECRDNYSSRGSGRVDQSARQQEQQAACEVGYKEGIGDGSICSRYTDPGLNEACRFGYDTYVADKNACNTAAGGESAVRQCQEGIRPGSGGPPGNPPGGNAPSNVDPGAVSKPVAEPPVSGDIKKERNDEPTEAKECSIVGFFGTMICGATSFAAKLTDQSFNILSIFLETGPITQTDKQGADSTIYSTWSAIRNISNILFALAFIVIIYSYITNTGVNNYNIKRMIPRLIVGAILINLSFTLCALMVDIANILGKTLADTIGGLVPPSTSGGEFDTWESVVTSSVLVGAAAVAGGAAAAYGTFSMLLPVLVSALVVVITTFVILMIRQVLIILLIIISPLAFAAILLPNTNSWFDKWRKIFIPLVMLYPAIALVYGLSQVAATIIQEYAKNQGSVLLAILALGVQVVPLFLTPTLMRLGGGVLNRFGGIEQSKFASSIRKKAQDRADHSKNLRDLHGISTPAPLPDDASKARRAVRSMRSLNPRAAAARGKFRREQRNKDIDNNLDTAQNADFTRALQDTDPTLGSRLYNKLRGEELSDDPADRNYTTRGDALAQDLAQSKDVEKFSRARNKVLQQRLNVKAKGIEAKRLELVNGGTERDDMIRHAINAENNVSELTQEAAILHIAKSGDIGAILAILKNSSNMSFEQRRTMIKTLHQSGMSDKIPFLGNNEAVGALERGEVNEANFGSKVVAPSLMQDDYSANAYAEMDPDVTEVVSSELNSPTTAVTGDRLQQHRSAAHEALHGSDTQLKVNHNRPHLERIAGPAGGGGGS